MHGELPALPDEGIRRPFAMGNAIEAMRGAAQVLLTGLAMVVSSNACALVNWDWAFENVSPVQPQDTVHVRATLFNDPSSTESLDMPSMFASVSFDSPLLGDQFNNAYPGMGFGHGDASPFTSFYPFISRRQKVIPCRGASWRS